MSRGCKLLELGRIVQFGSFKRYRKFFARIILNTLLTVVSVKMALVAMEIIARIKMSAMLPIIGWILADTTVLKTAPAIT